MSRISQCGLSIDSRLHKLVNEVASGTSVSPGNFWEGFSRLVTTLGPKNQGLMKKRDEMQEKLDRFYASKKGTELSEHEHRQFLQSVGYLVPEGPAFSIGTKNVDREVALIAGPQLVVPVDNARYALNAANARFGSLFDALYGSTVISEENGATKGRGYNPIRGNKVIEFAHQFLDATVPLGSGSYADVVHFQISEVFGQSQLTAILANGLGGTGLADASKFVGFRKGADEELCSILLVHNGLHLEIQIDRSHSVGKTHKAGLKDIIMESAVTTIQDFEDSVSIVDAEDKVKAYYNWFGLMTGSLEASMSSGGKTTIRTMNPDRTYQSPTGGTLSIRGRSLLLCRNVGHYMYTDAVTTADGSKVPEGFLDAMVTVLCASHDVLGKGKYRNSKTGSVYIVKPKQHGPEEVAFTQELFESVEQILGLPLCTIKIGIMDEERRTTVNLKECIRAAKDRVCFINTGFMDRTGDEIHSVMHLGPVACKAEIKGMTSIKAYEDWNVDVGFACGLVGKAQIGKGMWAAPDAMKEMVEQKIVHPMSGANCAWVPSPTAATLHSLHYHKVYVQQRQRQLLSRTPASLDAIISPPMLQKTLTAVQIQMELDNNVQGILGYVVRWVDKGVGCSKVPDMDNVGLMEDRATLRISSQHVANWLLHGLATKGQVQAVLKRMCAVVDRQNASEPGYQPLGSAPENSLAFQAASDLIFKGTESPNGYTEDILTFYRREFKRRNSKL